MERIKRPKELASVTRRIEVGCGSMYVTVGAHESKVIEVIAAVGKAGGCAAAQNEALGRAISLGLKWGVPLEEYIDQLSGIRCPNPKVFPEKEKCLSCADAFALALRENGVHETLP